MSISNFIETAHAYIVEARIKISQQIILSDATPIILSDGTRVEDPSDVHLHNQARDHKNKLLAERERLLDLLNRVHPSQRADIQAQINQIDQSLNPTASASDNSTSNTIAANLQNHLDALIKDGDDPKNDYNLDKLVDRIDVDQFSSMPISENNPLDKLNLEGTDADAINWLPPHMQEIVKLNPELQGQLEFLSIAATMPLDDFQTDFWSDASTYPQFDWANDGCSVPDWIPGSGKLVEGMEVPCIRHDFVYRNFERIDKQFGLNGALLDYHGTIENIADDQLGEDADSISSGRSRVVETGVELPGSGADSNWEEPDDWNDPDRDFYGGGYTPDDFD